MQNTITKIISLNALLLFILISNYTYAKTSKDALQPNSNFNIAGKVLDAKTGEALLGASIFIYELKRSTITDAQGNYYFHEVPKGKYLLEVSYMGYAQWAQTISVHEDLKLDIKLDQTAVEQTAVIVTGVSSATRIRQNPQPVSVIKKDEFMNTTSTNVIDALTKLVPGVNAVSTGPAISKPFIRGLGYNRVLTIHDGVRQEGQQWGDEHGIEIDDYTVQRVEVLKGPASLIYGSDALAGVINIISQTPTPDGVIRGTLLSEYQTNNHLRGFYGNLGGSKNGFSWNAYGSYKGAADYQNKYDGYVFNSKFQNINFGGMLGYNGQWGRSNLIISNFDEHLGIVEGNRDSATGKFIKMLPNGDEVIATKQDFNSLSSTVPFQHIRHFQITSNNNLKIGNSNLDLILSYQHNQRQEFGNSEDINTPNAWFNLQTITYNINWHLPYTGNFKTSFGVGGMYQNNQNLAEEVLIPEYNLFDIGAYVFSQYSKNRLSLSGGLRYDTRHDNAKGMVMEGETKFTALKKNFSNISGSLGLSYEVSKSLALKANIARGYRAPNFAELSSNGVHEGTNRYEIGDNNLKSEVSIQGDAGIEITSQHVSFDASLFYNHVQNFIFYKRLLAQNGADSTILDPESGQALEVFQFDQETANLYGAEVSLDLHPHPLDWLHFKNVFSYTRGKFTTPVGGSENLPNIPAARIFTILSGNFFKDGKKIRNLNIGLESDFVFQQHNPFTGFNTETNTPGYWLIGAHASVDIIKNNQTLFTLNITGENLGNIAYQNSLSRFKYLAINNVTGRQGVFDMGRNIGIKINIPLNFKYN